MSSYYRFACNVITALILLNRGTNGRERPGKRREGGREIMHTWNMNTDLQLGQGLVKFTIHRALAAASWPSLATAPSTEREGE